MAKPQIQPRALPLQDAAVYCGISPSTLIRRGPAAVHVGRRRIWLVPSLDEWLRGLSAAPADEVAAEEAKALAAIKSGR